MSELRKYQAEALALLTDAGRAIYADDMGTGKTPTSCRWLADTGAERSLVVSPRGQILKQWERELTIWHPDCVTLDGRGTKQKRNDKREAFAGGALLLGSYEGMRTDVAGLIDARLDTVIFDESHHLKNRQTSMFRQAAKLARRAERVLLVTGTPILNDAEELWSALHLIDAKGYPSFWAWARRHFDVEQTTFHGTLPQPVTLVRDLLPGHDEILRSQLDGLLVQRPLSLLLPNLPPVETEIIDVELSGRERTAYDTMKSKFWSQLGGDLIYASNEVAKITRLRQITSDWSAFEPDEIGSKVRACAEWLEHSEKALILVSFKQTAYALQALLGKDRALTYTGDDTDREREVAIDKFQQDDGPQVIIGTHGVVGEGVDGLQIANRIGFIDRDWTPARNDQAIARLRRSGQRSKVLVTHFVARNTVDQDVTAALERKQSVIDSLLNVAP